MKYNVFCNSNKQKCTIIIFQFYDDINIQVTRLQTSTTSHFNVSQESDDVFIPKMINH